MRVCFLHLSQAAPAHRDHFPHSRALYEGFCALYPTKSNIYEQTCTGKNWVLLDNTNKSVPAKIRCCNLAILNSWRNFGTALSIPFFDKILTSNLLNSDVESHEFVFIDKILTSKCIDRRIRRQNFDNEHKFGVRILSMHFDVRILSMNTNL